MQYRVEFLNNITCSIFENRKELEKWIKYNKKYYPIELEKIEDIRRVKKNGISETVMDIFL